MDIFGPKKEATDTEPSARIILIPDHLEKVTVGANVGNIELKMIDFMVSGIDTNFKVSWIQNR